MFWQDINKLNVVCKHDKCISDIIHFHKTKCLVEKQVSLHLLSYSSRKIRFLISCSNDEHFVFRAWVKLIKTNIFYFDSCLIPHVLYSNITFSFKYLDACSVCLFSLIVPHNFMCCYCIWHMKYIWKNITIYNS